MFLYMENYTNLCVFICSKIFESLLTLLWVVGLKVDYCFIPYSFAYCLISLYNESI